MREPSAMQRMRWTQEYRKRWSCRGCLITMSQKSSSAAICNITFTPLILWSRQNLRCIVTSSILRMESSVHCIDLMMSKYLISEAMTCTTMRLVDWALLLLLIRHLWTNSSSNSTSRTICEDFKSDYRELIIETAIRRKATSTGTKI